MLPQVIMMAVRGARSMCTNSTTKSFATTYRSTAMATRVNTEAETDTPCTKPLILHTILEKGQPGKKAKDAMSMHVTNQSFHR